VTEAHGAHVLLQSVAALVLSVGGAAMVLRAWDDQRRGRTVTPLGRDTNDRRTASHTGAPALIALLSASAAAIHLAAGPEHVEALGDLGLGFYWAALVQGVFAVAWLASSRSRRLASFGIAANLALVAAWAVSRTVGLPALPGGAEPVGSADAVTVLLEVGLVALLMLHEAPRDRRRSDHDRPRAIGTSALLAVGGVAVLATAIAMVDIGAGHHGEDQPIHGEAPQAHGAGVSYR
jgi:hypothetical protein